MGIHIGLDIRILSLRSGFVFGMDLQPMRALSTFGCIPPSRATPRPAFLGPKGGHGVQVSTWAGGIVNSSKLVQSMATCFLFFFQVDGETVASEAPRGSWRLTDKTRAARFARSETFGDLYARIDARNSPSM